MKLLIHDCNYLGDTLMSSPVYKAFKDAGHEVHSLGSPYQRELLEGNPYIDKIWTPKNQWKIIPQLRAERFDYCLQLNTSLKTNLFLSTLGSISIGYSFGLKGLPLDIKIPIDRPTCREGNRIEEIDDLIFSAFGLRLEPKMIYKPNMLGESHRWVIVLAPRSGRHRRLREWDLEKWIELANRLIDQKQPIAFLGSPADEEYILKIINRLKYIPPYYCWPRIYSATAVVRGAKLLITVNSFPLHLGISQGTPTLALIGRTPVEVIVHPSVTNFWHLQDPAIEDKSLKPMQFTVEEVLNKVKEILG